jgi:prevent-host-death family protein
MTSHPRAARRRGALPAFRNRRGERVEASAVTATEAKKQFARILEDVLRGAAVVITKHDAPKAILLSVDEFTALTKTADSTLDTLTAEFDALYARMQTPRARAAMQAAFEASPPALGRAAVAAARRRG